MATGDGSAPVDVELVVLLPDQRHVRRVQPAAMATNPGDQPDIDAIWVFLAFVSGRFRPHVSNKGKSKVRI
jgi:hypothetical protein